MENQIGRFHFDLSDDHIVGDFPWIPWSSHGMTVGGGRVIKKTMTIDEGRGYLKIGMTVGDVWIGRMARRKTSNTP